MRSLFLLVLVLAGCAAAVPATDGTTGPIVWQAMDFNRDPSGRYNFTVVLRETRGVGVTFRHLTLRAPGASPIAHPVSWRVPGKGELRQPFSAERLHCPPTVDCADPESHVPLTLRLTGSDDQGAAVDVTLGIRLPTVTDLTEQVARATLPAARDLPLRTDVPIQLVNNAILAPATLNDTQGVTLLVDTGAQRTILTPESARRAGLPVPASAPRRRVMVVGGSTLQVPFLTLRRLQVGDYVVENVEVGVFEVMPSATILDGILGMDVLGRFIFTIDHGARQLRLERR